MSCEAREKKIKKGELQPELKLDVRKIADVTLGFQTLQMYYHEIQNTSAQQAKLERVLNTANKLQLMYVFHEVIEKGHLT